MRPLRTLVAAVIVLLATATNAAADDFGTGAAPVTGWLADDGVHSFCFAGGMVSELRTAAFYAMGNSIDYFTDMSDQQHATCNDETDIFWFGGDLPAGIRGASSCALFQGPNVCRSWDVVLDLAELNIGANDQEDRYKTACHEAGHTVGLSHSATGDDCMRTGEVPGTGPEWRNYNAHHRSHINAQY